LLESRLALSTASSAAAPARLPARPPAARGALTAVRRVGPRRRGSALNYYPIFANVIRLSPIKMHLFSGINCRGWLWRTRGVALVGERRPETSVDAPTPNFVMCSLLTLMYACQ